MRNGSEARAWFHSMALVALCAVSACAGLGVVHAEGEEQADPILARAYQVLHRPLADAAELIGPVLSEEGELSLQPRLKTLVVVDRVSILDRVGALLESFDIPPRSVELTLTLIIGRDRSEDVAGRLALPGNVSDVVIDVLEKMQRVVRWKEYELVGSQSVTGMEGGRVTATLSEDYRVVFEIDSVDESKGKVRFKSLSVQKVIPTADGVRYQDIYTAAMVSPLGRLNMVGAASSPDSKKALFLALQAKLR